MASIHQRSRSNDQLCDRNRGSRRSNRHGIASKAAGSASNDRCHNSNHGCQTPNPRCALLRRQSLATSRRLRTSIDRSLHRMLALPGSRKQVPPSTGLCAPTRLRMRHRRRLGRTSSDRCQSSSDRCPTCGHHIAHSTEHCSPSTESCHASSGRCRATYLRRRPMCGRCRALNSRVRTLNEQLSNGTAAGSPQSRVRIHLACLIHLSCSIHEILCAPPVFCLSRVSQMSPRDPLRGPSDASGRSHWSRRSGHAGKSRAHQDYHQSWWRPSR